MNRLSPEALALAFSHHKTLAVGLREFGSGPLAKLFNRAAARESLVDMNDLELIVGSGTSPMPPPGQSAMMLIDGFQPQAITRLAVDSIFMMPHLGALSDIHPRGATQVFEKDCLIPLGTVLAPRGRGEAERNACGEGGLAGAVQKWISPGVIFSSLRGGGPLNWTFIPSGGRYWGRQGRELAPGSCRRRLWSFPGLSGAPSAAGRGRTSAGAPAAQVV